MSIGEFFSWWGTELAGMLPEGLRRGIRGRRDVLRLEPEGDVLTVVRRDGSRNEPLGRVDLRLAEAGAQVTGLARGFDAASTRVEVPVPREKLLVKRVQLPLAAEENLREVLGFEMQRQTPFRADQVYFNFRVLERHPGSQQLDVELVVAPRAAIDSLLGLLAGWRLTQARDPGASTDLFAFVADEDSRRASGMLPRLLVAANLALLVAVIAIPLAQQREYLDALRAELADVRRAATAAADIQDRIDTHRARARYLFARKMGQPTTVEILEELSRRLPDDTWLFRAEIRDGRVHLQGTSTRSSALIAALEASRMLEGARFASPVTQDANTGRERFHLSAAIVMPPERTLAGSPEDRDS